MENQFVRTEIAEGVHFSVFTDSRFKANQITVIFEDLLDEKTASANALIPSLLSNSSAEYPTMRELNKKLLGLYSANLTSYVRSRADIQLCGLCMSAIDDRYAIDNENVMSETVKLLCGCLFRPYLENGAFSEKTVETEKQNLIDANDAEMNDKALYAYRRGIEKTFKGEPAAVRKYGENDSIRKITPQSAYSAYLNMIKAMNAEILCVGKSSFDEAKELFAREFRGIGRRPAQKPENKISAPKPQPASFTEAMDVEQCKLFMSFKTGSASYYANGVMSDLLGGGVTSKLFTVVREKLSLCYYCYSIIDHLKGTMTVESGVERENLDKARSEILRQLDEIKKGNFTDSDLDAVKIAIQNNLRSVSDGISSVGSWYLSKIIEGKTETPEEAIEKFLAVTREEVIEAAKAMTLDTTFVLEG